MHKLNGFQLIFIMRAHLNLTKHVFCGCFCLNICISKFQWISFVFCFVFLLAKQLVSSIKDKMNISQSKNGNFIIIISCFLANVLALVVVLNFINYTISFSFLVSGKPANRNLYLFDFLGGQCSFLYLFFFLNSLEKDMWNNCLKIKFCFTSNLITESCSKWQEKGKICDLMIAWNYGQFVVFH